MSVALSESAKESIKSAASKLTSWKRREFQAEMALKYCDGSPRKSEQYFGWGRAAVATGLGEKRTGFRCIDNVRARGRKRAEDLNPELAKKVKELAEPQSQADPKFQSTLTYTRVTAKAVRREVTKAGVDIVPSERSMHRILNRMGYCTRRVQKTKPQKNS